MPPLDFIRRPQLLCAARKSQPSQLPPVGL